MTTWQISLLHRVYHIWLAIYNTYLCDSRHKSKAVSYMTDTPSSKSLTRVRWSYFTISCMRTEWQIWRNLLPTSIAEIIKYGTTAIFYDLKLQYMVLAVKLKFQCATCNFGSNETLHKKTSVTRLTYGVGSSRICSNDDRTACEMNALSFHAVQILHQVRQC